MTNTRRLECDKHWFEVLARAVEAARKGELSPKEESDLSFVAGLLEMTEAVGEPPDGVPEIMQAIRHMHNDLENICRCGGRYD